MIFFPDLKPPTVLLTGLNSEIAFFLFFFCNMEPKNRIESQRFFF